MKGDPKCKTCDGAGEIEYGCGFCGGSGEGMYDGSVCSACRGDGGKMAECPDCWNQDDDNTDDQINEMWSDEGIGGIK
jgi:hypothetical protein